MKYCKKCNTSKPLVDFGKDKSSKDGLNRRCKKCSVAQSTTWWQNNKNKKRNSNLKYAYGISLTDFEQIKLNQNNQCAICYKVFVNSVDICVDHCHTNKKVRGLLCNNCNKALGLFKDSLQSLENAIQYLKINKGETN
jgi:hypothetical protein